MKLSLTNLILLMLAVAIACGWLIDRFAIEQKYSQREDARVAAFRAHQENRLTSIYLPHEEEPKIYDILDRYKVGALGDRKSNIAFKILAICSSRDEIEDEELTRSFIRIAMFANDWKTIDDLSAWTQSRRELIERFDPDQCGEIISNALK